MTARTDADDVVQAESRHGAHDYDPLRIVLCRGEGVWVRDAEDRRYDDALSAYSAMNLGHRRPAGADRLCAVGREVLRLLADGRLIHESAALGDAAAARLHGAAHPAVREVRERGLWLGIDLVDDALPARRASEQLMERGVLAKDTHETTLRIAPPLITTAAELDWALERLDEVLAGLL